MDKHLNAFAILSLIIKTLDAELAGILLAKSQLQAWTEPRFLKNKISFEHFINIGFKYFEKFKARINLKGLSCHLIQFQ